MKPSIALLPSSSLQQPSVINRQQTNLSESYQAQSKGVSIALTTREDDIITISQRSATSKYRKESATADSSGLIEQNLRLNSMEISVQGDLNQQELDDLSRLLDDLGSIANDFFTGHMGEAITGTMNIGDMGSISRLEATFTRTSILSNYLQGPHPLPTWNQDFNTDRALTSINKKQANDVTPTDEPRGIDIMSAQWRQFLDAIIPRHSSPSIQKDLSSVSPDMVAKHLLERAKDTMTTHPRLTPLLPSVVDLALGQAADKRHPHEAATVLAKATITAFNSLFSDWIL